MAGKLAGRRYSEILKFSTSLTIQIFTSFNSYWYYVIIRILPYRNHQFAHASKPLKCS